MSFSIQFQQYDITNDNNMKQKNIFTILPLIFSFFIGHADAVSLSVDMIQGGSINNSLSSTMGSSFNVDIILNDAVDFAGFEFDLEFNNSILNATSITSGNVFGLDTFLLEEQININSIGFSETTFAITGLDIFSPTVLATISFDIVGAGTDILTLSNVVLSDSFGFEISPVVLSNGSLTTPSVPAPNILILIVLGLASMGWRKYAVLV